MISCFCMRCSNDDKPCSFRVMMIVNTSEDTSPFPTCVECAIESVLIPNDEFWGNFDRDGELLTP